MKGIQVLHQDDGRKQSIICDENSDIVIRQAENSNKSKKKIKQLQIQNQQDVIQQPLAPPKSQIFPSNHKLMKLLSLGTREELARELIQNFIKVTDSNGVRLQKKYDIEYIRQFLQRDLVAFEIEYNKFVQNYGQTSKGINLVDFIFIMISLVDQPSYESIYLIIAIIDFFEAVTQVEKTDSRKFHIDEKMLKQTKNYIKLTDITLFLCENHPFNEQTLPPGVKIPTKALPIPKIFDVSKTERVIREIDLTAPIIYRDSNESLQRLNKDKIHIDSVHHNNGMIMKSLYANEINKLIVLDQYSDIFIVYDNDCQMQQKFRPTGQHLRGQVCIDFFWSEKQLRVGSVFRDNFLVFWDANDNFSFEKSFNVGESILEEQAKIWYINCVDKWITSDNHKSLNFWNLEKEEVTSQIRSDLFSKGIIGILEVDYLKVVVIGSSDNIVSVWDFMGQKLLFQINVSHTHLNSMCYFQTYQVILTGGYDNQICIYQFHPTYNDANKMGELYGHMSIVTAFKGIEGTPMVISCDDKYNVKIWDIRTTNCIQSIDIDLRNPIKQIHTTLDRVFFQSSRVTSVEFDIDVQQKIEIKKKAKAQNSLAILAEGYQPVGCILNVKKQELIACTSRDVRFFDIHTGKIKKIIASLSENKEDQISAFQILDSFQKILIGTQKGILRIHDLKTGELLSEIASHTNEITGLRMDHLNKLLLSTSSDSSILIQKINPKLESQKYREVLNSHYGQEITLAEVSVYHNIFITASYDNTLLIWSYEFGRLMASFELEQDQEPTAITIINGYSIIIVATTKGYIYFIRFTQIDDNLDLEFIANINIIKSLILRGEALKKLVASEVKRAFQLQENESRKLKLEKKKIQLQEDKIKQKSRVFQKQSTKQFNSGPVTVTDKLSPTNQNLLNSTKEGKSPPKESKQVKKLLEKTDLRKTNINKGIEDISKKKIDITDLYNENEVKIVGDDKELFDLGNNKKVDQKEISKEFEAKKESNIYANKLVFDLCLDNENKIDLDKINEGKNYNVLPETCTLIVGVNNGEIRKYDISSIFKRVNIKLVNSFYLIKRVVQFLRNYQYKIKVPHCRNKMNYNAFRQNFENYTNSLSNHKIQCFKQNKNNIIKDIIVLNNMNRSKVITKFQTSVMKLSQVRGLIMSKDDSERAFDPYFNQSKNMVDLVQGHKSQLTSLEFLKIHNNQNEMIISCGQDNYIKIWNFFGKIALVAAVNILHPLPILWDFKIDYDLIYQNKILIAIQSQEAVIEKFNGQLDFSKYQKFNIRNLMNFVEQREKEIQNQEQEKLLSQNQINKETNKKQSQSPQKQQVTQKEIQEQKAKGRSTSSPFIKDEIKNEPEQHKKTKLMKDEYTPKDLLFDKIKHLYSGDLTGPSLKQLQEIKRIENSKNQSNNVQHKTRRLDEYQYLLNQEEQNKDQKFYQTFFHPDYRKKMLEKFNEAHYYDLPVEVRILDRKLDNLIAQKSASEAQMQQYLSSSQPQFKKNSIPNSMMQIIPQSAYQNSRQASAKQINESNQKISSVSPSRQRFSQVSDLQGIFVTMPQPSAQTIFNNMSDQIIQSSKNVLSEKGKLNPAIIVSEAQSVKNSNRGSALYISTPSQSGVDIMDSNQRSLNKLENIQQQENSTGYGSTQNNFLKVRKGQQNKTQQLYFPQKYSSSSHQLVPSSTNIIKSQSQEKIVRMLNIPPFDKSQSQNLVETETSNNQQDNFRGINKRNKRYPNNGSLKEEFCLKKEAKEIFNFNKKIPQSTTETYSTGGEYLIKINQIERNHGLKFKLFENTHKGHSQTARNSISPSQNLLKTSQKITTTMSNQQSIHNQVGSNSQIDPFQYNSPKEFLNYAQQKSLMSSQLQENYLKQSSQLTTAQVKSYFLNQIENEEDRCNFNDKFETTVVQNQNYHMINQQQQQQQQQLQQPIQTQYQQPQSGQNLSEQKINLNQSKPQIPPLNLSQNINSNQIHSNSQISSGQKHQNFQSLTQRGSTNAAHNDFDSTQDSSMIPINSSKQYFSKTYKKCFQDVVRNLNTKLNKSRINHNNNKDYNFKSSGIIDNDSINYQETLQNYQMDDFNNMKPFLSHRTYKMSHDDLLKNSQHSQTKANISKQQVSFK